MRLPWRLASVFELNQTKRQELLLVAIRICRFVLLVALAAFGSFISIMIIPREERFLERNFHIPYSEYKAAVRRWL